VIIPVRKSNEQATGAAVSFRCLRSNSTKRAAALQGPPLKRCDRATFHGGDTRGHTDYLAADLAAAV
jgi:hypothetical protein